MCFQALTSMDQEEDLEVGQFLSECLFVLKIFLKSMSNLSNMATDDYPVYAQVSSQLLRNYKTYFFPQSSEKKYQSF